MPPEGSMNDVVPLLCVNGTTFENADGLPPEFDTELTGWPDTLPDEVEGGPEANEFLTGSTKKSEGENASGLLCCEGESPLWVDRATDGAFLRTGRIQGGRVALAGPSWRDVSRGMLVTNNTE